MTPKQYFECPKNSLHRSFEALKFFFSNEITVKQVAEKFNFSISHFKRLRQNFLNKLESGVDPFFQEIKPGPKKRQTEDSTIERVSSLRKQNYSIADIRACLQADNISLSLETIDNILKAEGFAPLPKRTNQERFSIILPKKIIPPKSQTRTAQDETFHTEIHAGRVLRDNDVSYPASVTPN